MDVPTIPEGCLVRLPALVICSFNRHRDGDHIGHGVMKYDKNEWIMDLIGIALVALIIIWALS